MFEIILFTSILINVSLFWYGFLLLRKVVYVSGNTSEIIDAVEEYRQHLNGVYEMELFYGDETLKSLLDHTDTLSTFLNECDNAYGLTESEYEKYVQSIKEEETPENEQGRR